jgi:hypothetical protein
MNATYRTCTYIYDTGGACNSAAVKEQNYCAFHLRHRAHLMRAAKARARGERFELKLPPLESMQAVQAALSQLAQALDADMIDVKRADRLIRVLNLAARNLLKAEKWPATSIFHSDQSTEIDVAAQYGLPTDVDFSRTQEEVFPTPEDAGVPPFSTVGGPQLPDVGNCGASGHQPLATDHSLPQMPFSGNYCGYHHSRECECCRIRADYPVTPEAIEVVELYEKYGDDLAGVRSKQLERNRQRRELRNERKRYEAIALERNMRRAADLMAQRQLAERSKQDELTTQKTEDGCPTPPSVAGTDTAECGCPIPPSFGGVGSSSAAAKKPAASVPSNSQTVEKAELTPTG